jgi:hypothetical protein
MSRAAQKPRTAAELTTMSLDQLNAELSYLRKRIEAIGGRGPVAKALKKELARLQRAREARITSQNGPLTHSHRVVSQLEITFLPLLNRATDELVREYPHLVFRVWSSSSGSATPYQGHDLGIECQLVDARGDEANCLALEIGVWHITTEPKFNTFGVDWCDGTHPEISTEKLHRPMPVSPASLSQLARDFPELLTVFRQAIKAWSSRGAG